MNVLIFGVSGQDGHYLKSYCEKLGMSVVGCSRSEGPWRRVDISDFASVEAIVASSRPDYVFHLAANSTTRHEAMFENHQTIATGTLNLLEACSRLRPEARIFLAGSGLQFKNRGEPISEGNEFDASSAYVVARNQSVYAGRYFRSKGLRVYCGYLFHHESPLRKPGHVSRVVASAAARIANGSDETLVLGDSRVEKEWTFAGDVVEGMWYLVNQNEVFEAVIGSGEAHSIAEWATECFSRVGLNASEHVKSRTSYIAEYDRLLSSPRTIKSLGWVPRVSFKELASMIVESELNCGDSRARKNLKAE
jgi:GDPmannose 4,6-dehydratase